MTPPSQDDLGAIADSPTATELTVVLKRSLRGLGFASFEYYWFTRSADRHVVYSLESRSSPRSRRRLWFDPFIQHCRIAYTPVVWQALSPDASVRKVVTWSPWKGLPIRVHSGVAIPVHGPDGGFGLLNARVAEDGAEAIPAEHVHSAHTRALAVYERLLARQDDPRFGLTCDLVDSQETARLAYETVEKSRLQPAAKH